MTRPVSSVPVDALRELVQAAARRLPVPGWLVSVGRWVYAATVEVDPVKRFLWAFLGLEILCNELGKDLYPDVANRLTLDAEPLPATARESLVRPWNELGSLRARFLVVALELSPDTVDADVADFGVAKNARDDLAHGRYAEGSVLPTQRVEALLRRYVDLGIRGR